MALLTTWSVPTFLTGVAVSLTVFWQLCSSPLRGSASQMMLIPYLDLNLKGDFALFLSCLPKPMFRKDCYSLISQFDFPLALCPDPLLRLSHLHIGNLKDCCVFTFCCDSCLQREVHLSWFSTLLF
jgi:hypothetical protein